MPDVVFPLLAGAVALFIALLSLLPGDARLMTMLPPGVRRLGHLSAYVVFAFFLALALRSVLVVPFWQALTAFLVATGFGLAMEFLQRFRPGRVPSRRDVLVDAAGAALGSLAGLAWILASS